MYALIGLGNPGKIYQNTRHNLGTNLISKLLGELSLPKSNKPVKYRDWIIAIPTIYMNQSGLAVQKILSYYKIVPENLYVAHDDLDLKVGDYKIQFDRGPAGHNGIKSIIENLGTQAFNRIRIGIDHPSANIAVEDYVLKPFLSAEKSIINQTIDKILPEIKNLFEN
jgi:PTH1 family peptidyl-tRNA hydrolase